jgi:hypothetical protein
MLINLPENISYFQISRIFLDPIELWLCLDITNPIGKETFSLEFRKLAYFSITKTPDDDDGYYLIGDIKLIKVNDISSLLDNLGGNFFAQNTNCKNGFYHLHIEGDLCIDIVSCSYKLIKI